MIIVSLIFLAFIVMNIILYSVKTNKIDDYMREIEKELWEELKIIK